MIPNEDIKKIKRLSIEGYSTATIAKKLNLQIPYVANVLRIIEIIDKPYTHTSETKWYTKEELLQPEKEYGKKWR